jgi:hypothetical protein
MLKTVEKWFLFQYIGLELTQLSKPFESRELAEKEWAEAASRATSDGVANPNRRVNKDAILVALSRAEHHVRSNGTFERLT